jgi:predicted MPP superfamily phosphohydrolase
VILTRRAFLRTGVAAGAAVAGAGVYGFAFERNRVTVTRATAAIARPHAGLDGLRIGILTDLHHSALVSEQHVLDAARTLMAERPDLIVLLGDFVTWGDRRYADGCAEALSRLSAPLGVFAILGNHDDEQAVPRALAACGFDVLMDARTQLRLRGENVTIAGIKYWTKRAADIERVTGRAGDTILLAHDPRRLFEAAGLGIPLVLSGHTHGGQIVLPLVGAVAARKYPVAQGLARSGDSALFVSRGVGTVFLPVRLNCPPEAAIVTLRCVPG